MCNEQQIENWARTAISRRGFTTVAGAGAVTGAVTACAPSGTLSEETGTNASGLIETDVAFPSAAGTMDGLFIHPANGQHPAVIFWPDIAGIRESKRIMARRVASEGYAVLILNPYYRDVAGEQFADFASFAAGGGFQKVRPWRAKFTAESVGQDAGAAVAWLDQQEAVDTSKGIGAQGYCMTGSFTIWAAAAVPDRIKAAASFHGGRLVQDDNPGSPHAVLEKAQAAFLIAVAKDDDARAPEVKTKFSDAAKAAGREATVKVYEGDHGWTVPDSPAYAQAAGDAAFADLLSLYKRSL